MLERNYKLVFLPLAEEDLTEIVLYISYQLQNPTSAMHVMNRIRDAIDERSLAPELFQKYESAKNDQIHIIGSTSARVIPYSML